MVRALSEWEKGTCHVGGTDLSTEWPSETRDLQARGEMSHTHSCPEQAEVRQLLHVLESYQMVAKCSHC